MVSVLSGNEDIALRLGSALVLGSILGLNRELHGKAAGLRTHALVTLGAAVATLVALRSPDFSTAIDPNAASRIVQGILTGIGFLGAGVILRDSSGHVSGLTTASTIWICAVLGIVCGLGYWLILAIALVLTLIALFFGKPIERFAERCFKPRDRTASDHD
jgi:putative Mg2+ transporter-C (MgtC) family protein